MWKSCELRTSEYTESNPLPLYFSLRAAFGYEQSAFVLSSIAH